MLIFAIHALLKSRISIFSFLIPKLLAHFGREILSKLEIEQVFEYY